MDGGQELSVPPAAQGLASAARLSVVGIGGGRRAVVIAIPDTRRNLEWKAVVVAPLGGTKPEVVFQGWTGLVEGQDGERRGPVVLISEPEEGTGRRLVIGELREELSLCGRPAVLAPKMLSPDDLKLHPAKVQRLTPAERESASLVTARRMPDGVPSTAVPLLRAVAASSAVGGPAALTDGNPETTWAENRGGSGRGEFVLMHAPPDLPILGFELTIRPPKSSPPNGGAPREFWLATSREVIKVSLPEDGWRFPGARYEIVLGRPIRSDCLALITESAYSEDKNLRVSFAELSARTEFSSSSIESLVAALAGGGERSQAAGSVLRALGQPGFDAVAAAFPRLDEGGRRVALEILDSASCATSAPIYLAALRGPFPAQRIHGRDRLRRCGEKAADLLEQALKGAKRQELTLLADELALLAPDRALRALVPKLRSRNSAVRREIRIVLARAMASPRAASSVRELLRNPALEAVQTIDVLRALGPGATRFLPESAQALGRLASPQADFRTRYLLLEPAAELDGQDPGARAFLRRALIADQSPYVRAEAARRVRVPAEYQAELLRGIDDPELRVREAAITTVGERRGQFALASLLRRLEDDDWPLIRGAAAEALGNFAPDGAADQALAEALEDESANVRAPAVRSLGARRAMKFAPVVRARLEDEKEAMIVRASAAAALGLMCDRYAVTVLASYASKLSDPLLTGDLRVIAPIALASLSRIHPPDLEKRLSRLLDPKAPPPARRAAQAAIAAKGACDR